VPHFEKMLYDNAQLLGVYARWWRQSGDPLGARVARQTAEFLLAELRTEQGGFASALDADTEGVEGRFYVWTRDELLAALAEGGIGEEEAAQLADAWGVTRGGNWEGTNVLHRAGPAVDEAVLETGRAAVLASRGRRTRPARDDKQLAAWNGLALRAFAHAALVLGDPAYREATETLVAAIGRVLVHDEDRLWRTARDGRGHTPAFCEDYLAVSDGMLSAHAVLGSADSLLLARRLADRAIEAFWDEDGGTFVDTSTEHERTVAQPRGLVDNATPSANSIGADLLQRLALLTGDEAYARRARSILAAVAGALDRSPSAFGRMLSAADRWLGEPVDVVVAVVADPAEGSQLRRAAAASYVPDLVVGTVVPGHPHAEWPLFAGKVARNGRATAYACRGYACDAPTDDPARLAEQVRDLNAGDQPAR